MSTQTVVARDTSAVELIRFLDLIDDSLPADVAAHVIIDNASTHKSLR